MLLRSIVFLTTWSFIASAYAAEPLNIRFLMTYPPQSTIARGAEAFRAAVNEQLGTAGRVEVVVTPSSGLEALFSGKADLVTVSTSSLVSLKATEKFVLFDLPFFFNTQTEVAAVQNAAAGEALLASAAQEKLVALAYWNLGFTQLFNRKDVRDASHLKGLMLATTASPQSLVAATGLETQIVRLTTPAQIAAGQVDVADILPSYVARGVIKLDPMSVAEANYRPLVAVVVTTKEIWKKWSFQVQSRIAEELRAAANRTTMEAVEEEHISVHAERTRFHNSEVVGRGISEFS